MQVIFEETETIYLKNVMKMLHNDKEDTLKLHELNSPLLVHMHWNKRNIFPVITRRLHSLVVVRIDTNFILLEVECILASVNGPKLMVTMKVRPSPQAAVDDMRQAFTMRNLKAAIQ